MHAEIANETPPTSWSVVRNANRRLFFDRQLRFWLRELDPTSSLNEVRARIAAITPETYDTKTFRLQPNRRWLGFEAGQYVTVEAEIDGVLVRRCYSISSAPSQQRSLSITVKRVPGGRFSGWLHDRARVGDVVTIGAAAGDFVVPRPAPPKLLFVGGGSGITPIFSILSDLASRGGLSDATLLHYAPTSGDWIFRAPLTALADRHPGLRLIARLTRGSGAAPRFGEAELRRLVPDFEERAPFVCGPPALLDEVERVWARCGSSHRLRRERFVAPAIAEIAGEPAPPARVTLARTGRSFESDGRSSLLEQAERAGESPAYGCRMGICHTCKCRKLSGAVRNLVTGAVSTEPDEEIQLCVSVARSDVALNL